MMQERVDLYGVPPTDAPSPPHRVQKDTEKNCKRSRHGKTDYGAGRYSVPKSALLAWRCKGG